MDKLSIIGSTLHSSLTYTRLHEFDINTIAILEIGQEMSYLDIELGRSNKTIESITSRTRGYRYRRYSIKDKIVNYINHVGY